MLTTNGHPGPGRDDDALFAALEAQMVDGRTPAIVELETANAAARLALELDSPEVLEARLAADQAVKLAEIATAQRLAEINAAAERDRAERAARIENTRAQRDEDADNARRDREVTADNALADLRGEAEITQERLRVQTRADIDTAHARSRSSYLLRQAATDPSVQAGKVERHRPRLVAVLWALIALGLAYTGVHVHTYLTGGAPAWSSRWISTWGVDGIVMVPTILILFVESTIGRFDVMSRPRRILYIGVEVVSLGAAWMMNLAPDIKANLPFEDRIPHIIVPLWTLGLSLLMTLLQDRYRRAVTNLDNAARRAAEGSLVDRLAVGATGGATGPEYSGNVPAQAVSAVGGVGAGSPLGIKPGEIPSATQLRRILGVGTDKARAIRDALGGK